MIPLSHPTPKNGSRWMSRSASIWWRASTSARGFACQMQGCMRSSMLWWRIKIALGDALPVQRTVGSVLIGHMNELLGRPEAEAGADPNRPYYAALDRLAAKDWSRSG